MVFILRMSLPILVGLLLKVRWNLSRLLNLMKQERNSFTFFSEKEFNNLTPSCSLKDMNYKFMDRLDLARRLAGIPFVLNCAYRSTSWDKAKGRSGLSYHCIGRAVDIRCNDSSNRFKIIYSLLNAGFTSIGIYKHFIHVDDRITDDRLIWIGDLED